MTTNRGSGQDITVETAAYGPIVPTGRSLQEDTRAVKHLVRQPRLRTNLASGPLAVRVGWAM